LRTFDIIEHWALDFQQALLGAFDTILHVHKKNGHKNGPYTLGRHSDDGHYDQQHDDRSHASTPTHHTLLLFTL
jgi:hypothetical protein